MMNKIDGLSNMIVDYYSDYQEGYIGDTYKDRKAAIDDISTLLKESPRNQMEEIVAEVNNLLLNSDLRRNSNIARLQMAFTIALCTNEVMYDKSKELEA